ncbi:bifunctional phosphopantothenoylcysteine decarboxylase/phosphopantothenate--cysteine ligase CoaBC [Candidatus Micrarchaeota archaeon]|nr:bifunctional phosphopantothenoylcysteine decarboxylase/phosphopantothenate--cysteine ligase CoaBC [Candidatus Micrarchaeota archaeon]
MRFSDKTIIVGVTGSIAAYKALELVRALKKEGAEVHVIQSEGAKNFVSPLSFQTISGHPVLEQQFGDRKMKHIDLSQADALVVAPATANFVAKAAMGLADDLLTTTLQAFGGPVVIAPAMNDVMYENQVQRRNIQKLRQIGYAVVEPGVGDLACGRKGQGRLAASEKILDALDTFFVAKDLKGKTVLVTAGPTREHLDPVRFLSNASTGKMGYAFAQASLARGANVILVSGPTSLEKPAGVKTFSVTTAADMLSAVKKHFQGCDAFVSAAAPADFRPVKTSKQKIPKKNVDAIALKPTEDILAWCGKHKKKQFVLAFALEMNSSLANARKKLRAKNADALVLNTPENVASDNAQGVLVFPFTFKRITRKSKISFAHDVLDRLLKHA